MNTYQWLCLFGVPAIIGGLCALIIKIIFNKIKGVCRGVQALLRERMIENYNKWNEKGYAPIYAKQSFENCWQQYHSLGANGVMDDIHIKFLALPTEPPKEE